MTTEKRPPRLVHFPELKSRYGDTRSRGAIRRAMKAGLFPQQRAIGPSLVGWYEHELDAFYSDLPVSAGYETEDAA